MGHIAGHGRSGSLTKSFTASVKKSKSGKKYTSASAGGYISQTQAGIKVVKKKIGYGQTKHPTEGIVNTYATQSKKGGKHMYGQEVSKATDDYLIGLGSDVAKVGSYFRQEGGKFIRISQAEGEKLYAKGDPSISRSAFLTAKGKEMKYGKSGGAVGSGDPSGIITSIPISEAMFMQQKKIQAVALAGMSLGMPMVLGQGMRAVAAHTLQKPYSNYLSKFYKGQSGEANFAKAEGFANQGQDTANLAMGDTSLPKEKQSTKFTKKTTKYFAASYVDPKAKKRKMFATI
jgi:hypothetical protein